MGVNTLLTDAITKYDNDSWRQFRTNRNILDKNINKIKQDYLKNKFIETNDRWKMIKDYNGNNRTHPPSCIIHNGHSITSPKEISNIALNFFVEKVTKIRESFSKNPVGPIQLLSSLIPRNNNKFILPETNIKEMIKLISKLKSTNSHGHDHVTNKILKQLKREIAPHLVHLINSIIRTQIFPTFYKISRISLLSKPKKDDKDIANYRPINNLPTIEKIIETYILTYLVPFFNENKIINTFHHGGRDKHSPTTALSSITYTLNKNYENNLISAVISTDLTAAFDTVDTDILLSKLKYYGIQGNEFKLLENYMSNRQQFVQVDTFNSKIVNAPRRSVFQGSKMSGLLYSIYVNEVTLIHKLLNKNLYHNQNLYNLMTKDKIKAFKDKIENITYNFVDDSTSIISFTNPTDIKNYLTKYFKLLQAFYRINKLQINSDKTQLMLSHRPKFNNMLSNFIFMTGNDLIKNKTCIKILGFTIRNNLDLTTQIGNVCSNLHYRLHNIRQLTNITSMKTRLVFIKSLVLGKLLYAIPLYTQVTLKQLNMIHKVIMTSARVSIGSYCFKKSTKYILDKCNILNVKQMIIFSTLIFINKLIQYRVPQSILELYNVTNNYTKYKPKCKPKSKKFKNHVINRGIQIFNNIPNNFKNLPLKRSKRKLREYVMTNNLWDPGDPESDDEMPQSK